MRKKKWAYMALTAFALTFLSGTSIAAAGGMWNNATPDEIAERQLSMFTEQAGLLGVTIDEVKNAWAEGKTMKDLADEKGISEDVIKAKMKEMRQTKMQEHLSALVSKGVITQAQADTRLQTMEKMMTQGKRGAKGMERGMGGGFGFGL